MRDLAVVALEEVLAAHLPVRLVLRGRALEEAKRAEVEAGGGDEVRQLAEVLRERRRVGVRVDEDERPPGIDLDRHEAELATCRSRARARCAARRGASRRGRRSRRGRALERLALPLALADERAAVAADVQERAQRRLLVADDDDRDSRPRRGEERAGLVDLVGAACVLPRAPEDPLPLEPEHGRIRVPVEGKRAAVRDRRHGTTVSRRARQAAARSASTPSCAMKTGRRERRCRTTASSSGRQGMTLFQPSRCSSRWKSPLATQGSPARATQEKSWVRLKSSNRCTRDASSGSRAKRCVSRPGCGDGSSSYGCAAISAAPACTAVSIAPSMPSSTETNCGDRQPGREPRVPGPGRCRRARARERRAGRSARVPGAPRGRSRPDRRRSSRP